MTLDPAEGRSLGAKAMIFSAVFAAAAVLFYMVGFVQRSGMGDAAEVSGAQCAMRFAGMDVSATQSDRKIEVSWSDLADISTVMGTASAGIMACPGWQVQRFCIGTGCDRPGAHLELQQVGDKIEE